MKDVSIKINPISFPDQFATDKEKESVEYGLQVGQSIQYEWFKKDSHGCRFYDQRSNFHRLRLYARGEQSVGKYKNELSVDGDLSHLNLDWTPVPIIPKFLDIVVNGMTDRMFKVKAYAQDAMSTDRRNKFQQAVQTDMAAKDLLLQVKGQFGIDAFDPPPEELPETDDELSLFMQINYKPAIEIAEEQAINTIFDDNKYNDIRKSVDLDIATLGVGMAKHMFLLGDGVRIEYVDPANVIYSYTENPYFNDCFYWGEVKTVHTTELMKIDPTLTLEQLGEISKYGEAWNSQYGLAQLNNSLFSRESATLLYFNYKTTKKIVYKKKKLENGTEKMIPKDDTFNPPQEMMDEGNFEKVEKVIDVWYDGIMVAGTNIMLKWELSKNMVRPKSATQHAIPNYVAVAPRMYKGAIESLVKRMIPFADLIQVIHLKMQQVLARVVPDGVFIDADGINEVDLGTGAAYNPEDALRLYFQTGSVIGRSYTGDGEFNNARVPISELGTNSGQAKLQSLIGSYNANSSNGHLDMTALTNNSVAFIYLSSSNFPIIRILNSSNSLILDTLVSGTTAYTCCVKALSAGGFVAAWDTGTQRYLVYNFYNAAGSSLSSDRNNFSANVSTAAQNGSYFTSIVEMASNVAFITATTNTALSMTQANLSTYALRNFTTASQVVGSASNSVSAYSRANSTPNAAAFLASTSGTITQSLTATSTVNPTQLSSTQIKNVVTCVMPNGDIVIATTGSNPYPVTLYIYNPTGTTLQNTIVAYTGNSGGLIVKMCVLTNGNLLVVYNGTSLGVTSSTTISGQIYNSSYTLVSTTTLVTDGFNLTTNSSYTFNVSAMTNGRFVLGYWNSSFGPVAKVFNSDATAYSTLIQPASNSHTGTAVAGTADGGFVFRYQQNGTTGLIIQWYKNVVGANYYTTATTSYNSAGTSGPYSSCTVAVATNGTALSYYLDSSSSSYPMIMDTYGNKDNIPTFNTGASPAYGVYAMCTMPNNNFAVLKLDSSAGGAGAYIYAVFCAGAGASITSRIGANAITFNSNTPMQYTSFDGPIPSMCSTFDSQTVVAYANTSQYPCFFILNTAAATYSSSVVASTTASLPAYYPSQANGHILKGVAVTTATAGGTGVVQTNGTTQLNSQYPAATTAQAFDSTGTVIQGTKGTIVGRNITMTGGV